MQLPTILLDSVPTPAPGLSYGDAAWLRLKKKIPGAALRKSCGLFADLVWSCVADELEFAPTRGSFPRGAGVGRSWENRYHSEFSV